VTLLALTRTAHREAAALATSHSDRYLTHQVARQLGHDPLVVLSPNREAKYVQARAEVAQVLRELGWSYPRIGKAIGRGHSDVMFLLGASKRGRERLARRETA
jgi:chromosomal replication initiation ATPase DnaA